MSASVAPTALAVGPVMPGWGSWDWVGKFFAEDLHGPFRTTTFDAWDVPDADVTVVVKHAPPAGWMEKATARSAVVYCPIDWYGDAAEIDADAAWLRTCAKVIVHARRLVPHFSSFVSTSYLDHPLKFAVPTRRAFRQEGCILWVGVRSNLAPVVEWVNAHPLPLALDIVANFDRQGGIPTPAELGFHSDTEVRIHEWTPERQAQFTTLARGALDIKGDDFRSRHKPPAKALDFIASGVPLAMNPGSSPVEHLAQLGLKVPPPLETERWLSESYWKETRHVGQRLARDLTREKVASRARRLLEEALVHRPRQRSAVLQPKAPSSRPTIRESGHTFGELEGIEPRESYRRACDFVKRGEYDKAVAAFGELDTEETAPRLRALVKNDLAALEVVAGEKRSAMAGFRAALVLDPDCQPARANLAALDLEANPTESEFPLRPTGGSRAVRVAVVSLLFNWPSTGGGNVHTAELTKFLANAGYDVRHFYAEYPPWGIGRVSEPTPHPAEAVVFELGHWTASAITERFRQAIDGFDADWVVLTDSWNMKPLLAAAAGRRPYVLRLQASECLCPLNNVRLLPGPAGVPSQCTRHQLATPETCARCIRELGHTSGDLHRDERALAGVGTPEYRDALIRAFAEAACVLAVNPLTAAMVEPHAREVRVVTAGMDPTRFPWPPPAAKELPSRTPGRLRILFAGLTHEWMKGFHILREACARLWDRRQDFEVVVTDDSPEVSEPWARYVGWQSQTDLPRQMFAADLVVVPTVAQEALGRTAVEAMAAGKPVVASRLGGLLFTVADGATGLLCEPGNPADLAAKLSTLLDDRERRERLGAAGRGRFEEHYSWPTIIERHYRPLFGDPVRLLTDQRQPPSKPSETTDRPNVLVVVSHYAERSLDHLVRLLDSMSTYSPGCQFTIRVMVNRDGMKRIELPDRHRAVEVHYRDNVGYNIGAWEAGWRAAPRYEAYLFLQDECQVVRADWVAAFVRVAGESRVGLVGECLSPDWDAPWSALAARFRGHPLRDHVIDGRPAERVDCYLDFFKRHGIPPGERGDHLQSLVLFATRAVLERVNGFPAGVGYGEAIAAEIGISKKVQAAGLRLARVGPDSFTYIEHPQWLHRRVGSRTMTPQAQIVVGYPR